MSSSQLLGLSLITFPMDKRACQLRLVRRLLVLILIALLV